MIKYDAAPRINLEYAADIDIFWGGPTSTLGN